MRARARCGLLVLGLFAALTAAAAPSAVVETVQAPAWVERDGRRLALAPGMQLENRDRLLTGKGARANDEKDLVSLLEGHVAVSHPQGEPSELAEPMQFIAADKGQAPAAIATVDKVQLAKWSLETELNDGVGTQQTGGRWALDFGRLDKDGALTLHDQLSAAGYAGRIRPVRAPGGYLYELRLRQLVTGREAQSLADKLARELAIPAPAISRH